MNTAIGILLALAIGGACRYFNVPVPAPPTLIGVLLIACITAGYMVVDQLMK
jgi:XapX domain-containing protein